MSVISRRSPKKPTLSPASAAVAQAAFEYHEELDRGGNPDRAKFLDRLPTDEARQEFLEAIEFDSFLKAAFHTGASLDASAELLEALNELGEGAMEPTAASMD